MWATLIQSIATALRTALPTVTVLTVADAVTYDTDTVVVKRASSTGRPVYSRPTGVQDLAIECWTRHDDSATADTQLQALEENVVTALESLPRNELIMSLDLISMDPDGDLFRPIVGSQLTIRIHWRIRR